MRWPVLAFCLSMPALVLVAGCRKGSREERVPVIVGTRDLPAGTIVTVDDLSNRMIPKSLVTSTAVTADSASYLVNQRLLVPVAKGDPLRWSQFATTADSANCPPFRGPRNAFPVREEQDPDTMVQIVVFARDLPAGDAIDVKSVARREVEQDLVGPYVVRADELDQVIGQTTLVPVQVGDPVLFTYLPTFRDPKYCEWAFEATGNRWRLKGPPGAEATACPAGTKRLEGVPGGAAWKPSEPGWAVVCLDPDGKRHGPAISFSRLSERIVMRGAYVHGSRDGRWESFTADGALESVETWAAGALNGELKHGSNEQGRLVDGRREGPFVLEGFREAHFAGGLPSGTWITSEGVSLSPQGDSGPKVQLAVAARDLRAGKIVVSSAMATADFASPLAAAIFVKPEATSYLTNRRSRVSTPQGAPLLWCDFEADLEPIDPVAPPAGR